MWCNGSFFRILVKFNVNNTVDSEMPPEQQQGQEDGQVRDEVKIAANIFLV